MLDTLLSIPSLLLAIVLVAVFGPGLDNAVLAITLALIPQFIRATYNAVRDQMNKEYIIAVRLDGSSPLRILRLAILPNIVDTVVAQTTRITSYNVCYTKLLRLQLFVRRQVRHALDGKQFRSVKPQLPPPVTG